jgi:hypothetical protein
LEQARQQIQKQQNQDKPQRSDDERQRRDVERWLTVPPHLAEFPGEPGVIADGLIWTHRMDREASWEDKQGVRHIPVKAVCLGSVEAINRPVFECGCDSSQWVGGRKFGREAAERENAGLAQEMVANLIVTLLGEGKTVKAITRALNQQGVKSRPEALSRFWLVLP